MRKLAALADRTAVLFLGVAAGAAIGFAFGRSGEPAPERPVARPVRAAAANPPAGPAGPADARGFECALPFQQHLLDTVAAGKPVTVGVFGDSFGDGVWSALYRLLPASEHFRVLKYSQQSTGFTRYSSLNLEEHAQAQLAADGPVDVAVISFGANDTQGVYSGGHAAALMSPEWQRVIGGRVDRFVALMRAKGAMVYWVGLPKMRKASFDDDISAMNLFYTDRMKALRVPFIDIKPLTVDDAGEFTLYLPDPVSHERRLLRANDGVHMSMNGYVVITRALAERIKAYVGAARVLAGVGAAAPVAGTPARVAAPEPKHAAAEKPKHHDQPRKRDEGEHKHRDAGERDEPRPAKRDDAATPPRRESGEQERPAASEKRDRAAREHKRKAGAFGEKKSGDERSGEARSSASRATEPKPAASETRRAAAGDERKPAPADSKRGETHDKPSETRHRATEGKSQTPEAKKPRPESKAKSDDAPPKPRKRRDEPAPAGEGNSQ